MSGMGGMTGTGKMSPGSGMGMMTYHRALSLRNLLV
jgi:hypothetical protein